MYRAPNIILAKIRNIIKNDKLCHKIAKNDEKKEQK